jgi:hypothetical protein
MGRRRDDDEEDFDDRPSRRRGNRPEKKNNLPMILGIVGVVVVLIIATCGGLVYYAISSAKKMVDEVSTKFAATQEADNFLDKISENNLQGAYDSTTPSFKTSTSFVQFQQLIDKNLLMKKPFDHYSTSFVPPTGAAPNRMQVVSYKLSDFDSGDPDDLGDDPDLEPRPPIKKPKVNKPGIKPGPPGQKSLTVTITLAEQPGGFWKVEKFTVP